MIMAFVGMKKRTVSDMEDKYIKLSDAKNALADYIAEQTASKYGSLESCRDAKFAATGAMNELDYVPAADVVPKSEVEKIFEKLKVRECSNSVCAWCVHATDYGRRNEECDKPYIDKNGKESKACYMYAKFESLIDNELAELKKKYTEDA